MSIVLTIDADANSDASIKAVIDIGEADEAGTFIVTRIMDPPSRTQ